MSSGRPTATLAKRGFCVSLLVKVDYNKSLNKSALDFNKCKIALILIGVWHVWRLPVCGAACLDAF